MHLKPFTLRECEEFFKVQGFFITRGQIVESYMVFGGIPYYLHSPGYYAWRGPAFERVCLAHLPQIKEALKNLLMME